MTDRFEWNSVRRASWWKNNSALWYIMLAMGALGGLLFSTLILHDKAFSGLQSGLVGVWVCLTFICCWCAAYTHLARRKAAGLDPEVNIRIPLVLALASLILAILLSENGGLPLITAALWILFGMAWTLLLKNVIVFFQREWTRD